MCLRRRGSTERRTGWQARGLREPPRQSSDASRADRISHCQSDYAVAFARVHPAMEPAAWATLRSTVSEPDPRILQVMQHADAVRQIAHWEAPVYTVMSCCTMRNPTAPTRRGRSLCAALDRGTEIDARRARAGPHVTPRGPAGCHRHTPASSTTDPATSARFEQARASPRTAPRAVPPSPHGRLFHDVVLSASAGPSGRTQDPAFTGSPTLRTP